MINSRLVEAVNSYIDEQIDVATDEQLIKEDMLTEMANVRGKDVEVDDIDFSFYFSKKNSNHGIRVNYLTTKVVGLQYSLS